MSKELSRELKMIKKIYGEEMMQLCRDLLPDVLEEGGALLEILKEKFAPTHYIGHDIRVNCFKRDFRNYIVNLYRKKLEARIAAGENISIYRLHSFSKWLVDNNKVEIKAPFQMLSGKGYNMYECETEKAIQEFAKYYAPGEEICTLDGGRLAFARVFFFVRKDVDQIKRGSFTNPQREDEYSTSVLCVQFDRVPPNYVTVISRYNTTVPNPNFTCYNDLDYITPGLTESFKKYYGFTFERESTGTKFLYDMSYAPDEKDKFHRIFHEKHGLIFCDNNVVIRWHDADYQFAAKERYIFMDEYVLDRKDKKLFYYPYKSATQYTPFLESVLMPDKKANQYERYVDRIAKTEYEVFDNYNMITIHLVDGKYVKIATNKQNQIIYYENKFVEVIKRKFLFYNDSMLYINIPNVRIIKRNFMYQNNTVLEINAPNLVDVDKNFLPVNETLNYFYAPYLTNIGYNCLWKNPNFSFTRSMKDYDYYKRLKKDPELAEQVEYQRKRDYKSFFDKNKGSN